MIEFLSPRDGAFGDRDAADFVGVDGDEAAWGDDEPPRSRWLTALAVLGVTGLLAGGVIAAAPWDTADIASPPTTAAPTSPAPTTTVWAHPRSLTDITTEPTIPRDWPTTPSGWIPTEDSRYGPVYAYSSGEAQVLQRWGGMTAVFAADEEFGRTTGRWVAIDASFGTPSFQAMRRDGVVTTAGDRRVLVSVSDDGVVTIDVEMYEITGNTPVRIVGFGVGLDTLLAVASEIDLVRAGDATELDLLAVERSGALEGLAPRISERQVILSFHGEPGMRLASTDLTDGSTWASVAVIRQSPELKQLSELLLRRPIDAAGLPVDLQSRLDELARRGRPVELSRSIDGDLIMGRTELADDSVVLFTIDGSPVELVDLIETLRPASDDEWLDLLMRSANGLLEFPIASDDDPFVDIGNGNNWGANMSQQQFSLGTDRGGVWERFEHGQGPELVEYRSTDTAFLRVTTTFPNEARNIVVTQEGAEPQRARLVEIPGSGVLAAVIKLDPTLPYAVAWTDNDDEPVDGPVDAAASRAAANAGASP